MSLNTEIISVGTEILLGNIANTDARDVSQALAAIGINVLWHTVVGDNPKRLRECIDIAKSRADIIITTGGLGPTCDDLTKQTLAETFNLPLVMNENERQSLFEYTSNVNTMTENNFVQALIPQGGTVFHNSCGTAPGCAFKAEGKTVAMLPGPPNECRTMLKESLIPYLTSLSEDTIVSHTIKVFRVSESKLDDIFAKEMNAMTNPTMAPYAKLADCFLRVTAKAKSEEQAEEMLKPVIGHVYDVLGDYIFGMDIDVLEEAALKHLIETKKTFAIAEVATGGDAAARFNALEESGRYFKGGIVFAENYGEATEEFAYELAKKAAVFDADLFVGVTALKDGNLFVAITDLKGGEAIRQYTPRAVRNKEFIRAYTCNHVFDLISRA